MLIGIIAWFDQEKHFGVIKTVEGDEYFLHVRQVRGRGDVAMGMVVIFEKATDDTKKREVAINCRLMDREGDWPLVAEMIGNEHTVVIERKIRQRGHGSNDTEAKRYSLTTRGAVQIFRNKEMGWIKKLIIHAFDNHLDHLYFVPFCDLLEEVLPVSLGRDDAKALLATVYHYFGTRLDPTLLFYTWRKQRFQYIGKDETDYEIPEQVLLPFVDELTPLEWRRIQRYSFASSFNVLLFETQLERLSRMGPDRLRDLYDLLDLLPAEEAKSKRQVLVARSVSLYQANLAKTCQHVPRIETDAQWRGYDELKTEIGSEIGAMERGRLLEEIDAVIEKIASPGYRVQLWAKGAQLEVPLEAIYAFFLDKVTPKQLRCDILDRLGEPQQLEAMVRYQTENGIVNALAVLENYLDSINKAVYINLRNGYFSDEYWTEKRGRALLMAFRCYILENASDQEQYALFFEGYYPDLPMAVARKEVASWSRDKFVYLHAKAKGQTDVLFDLLRLRIQTAAPEELHWLCEYAGELLSKEQKRVIDEDLWERLSGEDYFQLWTSRKVSIIPEVHILMYLAQHTQVYQQVSEWVARSIIPKDILNTILLTFLEQRRPITTFTEFYRHWFMIQFLLEDDEPLVEAVTAFQEPFYALMLWALDYSEALDFPFLAAKFIYFNSTDQARVLRKVFCLKAVGKLDFSVDELSLFVHLDADLYKLAEDSDPLGQLDISAAIILEALASFAKTKGFLVEGELIAIAIRHLTGDKTRRFTFGTLLEKCLGRMQAHQDFNTQGTLFRVPFAGPDGNMTFYYALSFRPYITGRVFRSGFWQDGEVYNDNFEELKEEVKKIPGRKWNPDKMHWGVPRQFEAEVFDFAKRNRFLIDFGGDRSKDNIHLVRLQRAEIPDGICFCEGRIANKLHDSYDRKFWWCEGRPCFQNCETLHGPPEWERYTLFDFCHILHLDISEKTGTGVFLDTGAYHQFAAQLNRFNRLLDKMYCNACGEILYPNGTSNFAAHNVVRFSCTNAKCGEYQVEVYLNHCLNGKCNNVIDSRVSKQCPHGLRICDQCGSCCSHAMFVRQLQKLQATGGYIHPDLVRNVQQEAGHLEIPAYFCHKDGRAMKEIERDVFACACGVQYDTRKYKLKRWPRPGQPPVTEE